MDQPPSASRPPEDEELDRLVHRHYARWLRLAEKILRDPHKAQDLVQETLARILQMRCSGALQARNLAAYIRRAVRLNALKQRAREKTCSPLPQQPWPVTFPDGDSDWPVSPLELERAINTLPPAQQAVIRLRYYAGLSFRQIAQTLSLSINTVAGRCRYALINLRRILKPPPQ